VGTSVTFVRGDIFRVISAVHPMLWDAARDRQRLVIEAVDALGGIARVAFLDAHGDKAAAASIRVAQLEAAFLLREDLGTLAEESVAETGSSDPLGVRALDARQAAR
jgi:hypothetical protein